MSAIPSLSVWSSIKIPLTEYYGRSWNTIKSPVPYVGSLKSIKQKSNSETIREVVNLRVPSPFRKGKESSFSEMACACEDAHKKASSQGNFRIRHKNISCLCVPKAHVDVLENSAVGHSHHGLTYEDSYDDLCLNSDGNITDSDLEMEFDYIPSVKPWTPEELRILNKRFRLTEKKAKTPTDKKRKHKRRIKTSKSEQTTPKTPNKTSYLDSYKSHKSLSQNFYQKNDIEDFYVSSNENLDFDFFGNSDDSFNRWKEDLYCPVKPTGKSYYETKLAELYMIELGIKQ